MQSSFLSIFKQKKYTIYKLINPGRVREVQRLCCAKLHVKTLNMIKIRLFISGLIVRIHVVENDLKQVTTVRYSSPQSTTEHVQES